MCKVLWRKTSCYYQFWKHLHGALGHYTLLEILDVFSVCNSRTVCSPNEEQFSSLPYSQHLAHHARHAHPMGIIWSAICICSTCACLASCLPTAYAYSLRRPSWPHWYSADPSQTTSILSSFSFITMAMTTKPKTCYVVRNCNYDKMSVTCTVLLYMMVII